MDNFQPFVTSESRQCATMRFSQHFTARFAGHFRLRN